MRNWSKYVKRMKHCRIREASWAVNSSDEMNKLRNQNRELKTELTDLKDISIQCANLKSQYNTMQEVKQLMQVELERLLKQIEKLSEQPSIEDSVPLKTHKYYKRAMKLCAKKWRRCVLLRKEKPKYVIQSTFK